MKTKRKFFIEYREVDEGDITIMAENESEARDIFELANPNAEIMDVSER